MSGIQKVIAPVAGMPKIALRPVALLPEPGHQPEGRGEGQEVQHDRLAGEQQRAEGPGQEQERHDRDEGEHEREVAEHGVAVVLLDRAEHRSRR